MIQNGRWSQETELCTQQLYNNLATSANISEVYCVLDGLNVNNGEIPFFMFDQLIMDKNQTSDHSEASQSQTNPIDQSDIPEESEAAEYQHYPIQMAYFKKHNPEFSFRKMDEIPTISSPSMRTCDNSQYLSKAHGDASNTEGLCYSTPFYNLEGKFMGIISTVFRINTLKAILSRVPFLMVTSEDSLQALNQKFSMPEENNNFVLVNTEHDIYISDPREPALLEKVKQLRSMGKPDEFIYREELSIKDKGTWTLFYRYDPLKMGATHQEYLNQFLLFTGGILGFYLIAVAGILFLEKKRNQILSIIGTIKTIVETDNLTEKVQVSRKDEVGEVADYFNLFVDKLNTILNKLSDNTTRLASASEIMVSESSSIAKNSRDITQLAGTVTSSATETSSMMNHITSISEEMSSSIKSIALAISEMNLSLTEVSRNCGQASLNTSSAHKQVASANKIMSGLENSASEITKIIVLINAVAEQTNLLALNATIEAARAGASGKGFAVVANEVKALAHQTANATIQVRLQIDTMNSHTKNAVKIIGEITHSIQDINEISHSIASAVEEQTATLNTISTSIANASDSAADVTKNVSISAKNILQVSNAIDSVRSASSQNTEGVNKISDHAKDLSKLADSLETIVSKFKIA